MGISQSSSASEQYAQQLITQQYSGTCNMSCTNQMSDIDITVVNSDSEAITVGQYCTVDGNCMFNNTSDATADALFTATNSTNAGKAGLFQYESSSATSLQDFQQNINQSTTQTCDMSTVNDMNDVSITIINSNTGDIEVGQSGGTGGSCTLDSTLSAATYASGTADNSSCSGKKKLSCKMASKGKGSFMDILLYIIVGIVVIVGVVLIVKMFNSGKKDKCPNGMQQVKNPVSKKKVCPCPDGSMPNYDKSTKNYSCPKPVTGGSGGTENIKITLEQPSDNFSIPDVPVSY